MFDILSFKENLDTLDGLQHDCLFNVTIPIPPGLQGVGTTIGSTAFTTSANAISTMAEASNLPGMQLATSGVLRYGYGFIEKKPFMAQFATCDMRILADNDGAMWTYFQSWLNFICNYNASSGMSASTGFGLGNVTTNGGVGAPTASQTPYEVNYLENYAVDITITLYSPSGTQSMALVLRDAWPAAIGDPQLNWGSMNNILRLPVSFAFADWFNQAATGGTTTGINNQTSTQGAIINQTVTPTP